MCKYDLRKVIYLFGDEQECGGDYLFRLICGGSVCSILLLPLLARCLETMDVCIWCMFVFMTVLVIVWVCVNVCCVAGVVKDSGFL